MLVRFCANNTYYYIQHVWIPLRGSRGGGYLPARQSVIFNDMYDTVEGILKQYRDKGYAMVQVDDK